MKIHKKATKKPKPKTPQLTITDMVHWAYMHFESNQGRFKEETRVTAAKFHTDFSTIARRHERLCEFGCISADARTKDATDPKTKLKVIKAYFVPTPPAKYLRLASLLWDIGEDQGILPPVARTQQAQTGINSGSEPVAPMQHMTADVFNDALLTVDSSRLSNIDIVNSSVTVAPTQQANPVENKANLPDASVQQAQKLRRVLSDLQAKRKRYREYGEPRPDLDAEIESVVWQLERLEGK